MPAPPIASQAAMDQPSKARSTRPASSTRSTTTSVLPSGSFRLNGGNHYASSRMSNPSQASCRDPHLRPTDANTTSKQSQRDPSSTTSSQVKSATSTHGTAPDHLKALSQNSGNAPLASRGETLNRSKGRSQASEPFRSSNASKSKGPDSKESNGNAATLRASPTSATDQQQGSRARLSPTLANRQQSMTAVRESQQVASLKASGRQPQSQQEIPQPALSQGKSHTVDENSGDQKLLKRKPWVSDRTIMILRWFAYT